LYNKRNNIEELIKGNSSAMNNWLYENGKDTVEKFLKFEKGGFNKVLTFSGKIA
jgi:hypothetical protein